MYTKNVTPETQSKINAAYEAYRTEPSNSLPIIDEALEALEAEINENIRIYGDSFLNDEEMSEALIARHSDLQNCRADAEQQ